MKSIKKISQEEKEELKLSPSHNKQFFFYLALGFTGLLIVIILGLIINYPFTKIIAILADRYQQWLEAQNTNNPIILISFAFLGGLMASFSPCILTLLPVNLSYIGTLNIQSRWDAFQKSSLFVLGVVVILSLFGLVSSFAGAVMIDYRGYINIIVGLIMTVMGLLLLGIVKMKLPQMKLNFSKAGPFGVGLTFALIGSPCSSPILFAVLSAAGATGSQLLATLAMISYALGYTMLIFLASLFTGLAKQSRSLLIHSQSIIRLGSVALLILGLYYVVTGTKWFLGS